MARFPVAGTRFSSKTGGVTPSSVVVASKQPVNAQHGTRATRGLAGLGANQGAQWAALMNDPEVISRGIYFPRGTYSTTRSIPLSTSIDVEPGAIFQALPGMTPGPILDMSKTGPGATSGQRRHINGGVTIDANFQPGVYCCGSADGEGNSIYYVDSMYCLNTTPGVWAITADDQSGSGNPGALTGSHWGQLQFQNCPQWIKLGNNQADILFEDTRGTMVGTVGQQATGPVIDMSAGSYNVKFLTGYSYLTDSAMIIATLSSGLSTGGPITSLPVNALVNAIPATNFTTFWGGNPQIWTTTGAAVGATSIPVSSQTPVFAYPAGSPMSVSGIACFIDTGTYDFDFEHWFFECDSMNMTHIVRQATGAGSMGFSGCKVVFRGPCRNLRAFDYAILSANYTTPGLRTRNLRKSVEFRRFNYDSGNMYLTAQASAGDTTVNLNLPTTLVPAGGPGSLANGQRLVIDQGERNEEVITIANASATPPTCSAFAFNHASGTFMYQDCPLVEVLHQQASAAQGCRLTMHVEDCDGMTLGAHNPNGPDGWSDGSNYEGTEGILVSGTYRQATLNGRWRTNTNINTTPPLSTDRSFAGRRDTRASAFARSNSVVEPGTRDEAWSTFATLTSGTLFLSAGGMLYPGDPAVKFIDMWNSATTAGAGLTHCVACILDASAPASPTILAVTTDDTTAGWATNAERKEPIAAIPRGTSATLDGTTNVLTSVTTVINLLRWRRGDPIVGTGIPAGATVTDVNVPNGTITISANTTIAGSSVTLFTTGLTVNYITPIMFGLLCIGTTMPTPIARASFKGLTSETPVLAGNSNSGLTDGSTLIPGTVVTVPTDVGGAIGVMYAAALRS